MGPIGRQKGWGGRAPSEEIWERIVALPVVFIACTHFGGGLHQRREHFTPIADALARSRAYAMHDTFPALAQWLNG